MCVDFVYDQKFSNTAISTSNRTTLIYSSVKTIENMGCFNFKVG